MCVTANWNIHWNALVLYFLSLSLCFLSFATNNCYSYVALNNFHDQGCGSKKPPLASLTLLSFLPISELSINIYESIWIMWIKMTKNHSEKRNMRKVKNRKRQRWKILSVLKSDSSAGSVIWDKWDIDPLSSLKQHLMFWSFLFRCWWQIGPIK